MYCKNCGEQLADDSKYCRHCGVCLDTDDATEVTREKEFHFTRTRHDIQKINLPLLYTGIIMSFVLVIIYLIMILSGKGSNPVLSFFAIVPNIISLIIYFQWIDRINALIDRSFAFFSPVSNYSINGNSSVSDLLISLNEKKINLGFFRAYCFFSVLQFLLNQSAVHPAVSLSVSVVTLIIFGFMLSKIFKTENHLDYTVNKIYLNIPCKSRGVQPLKERNAVMVIIYTLITIGIYGIYFLIKHSTEINEFIDEDDYNQNRLIYK